VAKSQQRGRGNSKADTRNIDWMMDNGGLETIDPEDEGIPWPAKTRWNGSKDDEGSPWAIPPPGKRCTGKSYVRDDDGDYIVDNSNRRIMRPCHNWPMRGTKVCLKHGGGILRVRQAAMDRLIGSLDAAVGKHIKIIFGKYTEDADRLRAIKELYDIIGMRQPQKIDVRTPGWERVLEKMFMSSPAARQSERELEEEDAA